MNEMLGALRNVPMKDMTDEQWNALIASETDPREAESWRDCKRYFELAKRAPEVVGYDDWQPVGLPLTEGEKRELKELFHSTGADMSLV